MHFTFANLFNEIDKLKKISKFLQEKGWDKSCLKKRKCLLKIYFAMKYRSHPTKESIENLRLQLQKVQFDDLYNGTLLHISPIYALAHSLKFRSRMSHSHFTKVGCSKHLSLRIANVLFPAVSPDFIAPIIQKYLKKKAFVKLFKQINQQHFCFVTIEHLFRSLH
ncbi:hypothetical protein PPYR_15347 [Photinus pyralis]|uniref:Uncharacterized protein n=1 Tax=Photinus pyralis TaxID=7054 RepID=A0A1Y1LPZ2_PHOPY|nr:hypothetical protein PPYR_15347 [Photinus pyralis]